MEVSHVDDMTTHLVMSNQKAMAVTILDSPELMSLLSGALYKNPAYAMVREVICNAQDAHIEAGIPDTPIEIKITESRLIIRDFGKGIPRDQMAKIYGTYGFSTKKKQKNATGGFGLGSKSPWSFTDIFGVTSFNKGTKTIYRLIRSDAENNGKPGIIPIVEAPIEETGLEVSIPLGSVNVNYLISDIKEVVLLGDIPATLDGELLKTIPFNQAKEGFTFITDSVTQFNTYISIRYGSVIYPLEDHDSYKNEFSSVLNFLRKGNYFNKHFLVLHAQPDTLSIAPSRDHMTLESRTTRTIKELLQQFLNKMGEPKDYTQCLVEHFTKNRERNKYNLPIAQTRKQYAIMCATIKHQDLLKKLDYKLAVDDFFKKERISNKKLYSSLLKLPVNFNNSYTSFSWVSKYLYADLLQWKQSLNSSVSISLFIKKAYDCIQVSYNHFCGWDIKNTSIISLAKKTVVLTTRKQDLYKRIPDIDTYPELFWVVSSRSKSPKIIKEIEVSLTACGFNVMNLAELEEEAPKPKVKATPVPKVATPKGYYLLVNSINSQRHRYSRSIATDKMGKTTTAPVAYMEENNPTFKELVQKCPDKVVALLKTMDSTVVISNARETKSLTQAGIPHFFDYLVQFHNNWVEENKGEIKKYRQMVGTIDSIKNLTNNYYEHRRLFCLISHKLFWNALGINGTTHYERVNSFVSIFSRLNLKEQYLESIPAFSGLLDFFTQPIKPSKKVVNTLSKICASPHMNILDTGELHYVSNEKVAKKLVNILLDYKTEE